VIELLSGCAGAIRSGGQEAPDVRRAGHGGGRVPAPSTVNATLRRAAWWRLAASAAACARRVAARPITHANEVWTTDFKASFLTGDGRYCYPLTLRRWLQRVRAALRRVARAHAGVPGRSSSARRGVRPALRLRSGHGPPLRARAWGACRRWRCGGFGWALSRERIDPGHPEQTPRTISCGAQSAHGAAPAATATTQQRRFTRFVRSTTTSGREALDQQVPATRYSALAAPAARALARRSSIPGTRKFVASIRMATFRGGPHSSCRRAHRRVRGLRRSGRRDLPSPCHVVAGSLRRNVGTQFTRIAPVSAGRSASCAGSALTEDTER